MDSKQSQTTLMISNKNNKISLDTTDRIIRAALREYLEAAHKNDPSVRILDELGVNHGTARVDMAVVNGVMHGYEIKSDKDSLERLPEQIKAYNEIFDKITIVVGYKHIYEILDTIPDWWGVTLAKTSTNQTLILSQIRGNERNPSPNSHAIARLLWKSEALDILEAMDKAKGVKSKTRAEIYDRLTSLLELEALQKRVREVLFARSTWKADQQLQTYGGSHPPIATVSYFQSSF